MNAAQNGNIFGLPNNNGINNQNMNFNQNFMNQNMMMGNQNMMMNNPNMMMGIQNMMMNNPNMMMGYTNMMMNNPNMMMAYLNMMMGNQNCLNNQNNMGFNNMASMNGINMNNTNINSNNISEDNKKKDLNIHDKEEILPRNQVILTNDKDKGEKINLFLVSNTGSKIGIHLNKNSTLKEMAKKFCQIINLDERYLERIKFIYNAAIININSNSTLKDIYLSKNSTITVYDDDNVIGT